MDPFSYLSVLISIVLALGMTRVLAGVGDMLQARSHRRIYWVHAVWVVNLRIPRGRLVDLLPLAQSADLDVFSVRVRTDFAHNLVSRFDAPFPAGRRH